jgi:hypothetical protein
MPLITPEIASFLTGPNSMMVATRGPDLVPEIARVMMFRCAPDGERVHVAVRASEARTLDNLRADARVAVVAERMATHKTVQVKGRALGVRPLTDEERPLVEQALDAFARSLDEIGTPRRLIERVVRWPLVEIEIAVAELYDQSPGPGAGAPIGTATAAGAGRLP